MSWIRVDDRLPEMGRAVFAYADEWGEFVGFTAPTIYDADDADAPKVLWKRYPEDRYIALVRYWMPIPPLPTGEEGNG